MQQSQQQQQQHNNLLHFSDATISSFLEKADGDLALAVDMFIASEIDDCECKLEAKGRNATIPLKV